MQRKYKINYFQNGGTQFYLPCEISHLTKNFYFNDITSVGRRIKAKIGNPTPTTFTGLGYYQDSYVQLFDGSSYKNLLNVLISDNDSPLLPSFQNDTIIPIRPNRGPRENFENEHNKGGNFISSPDGTIFTIEGASNSMISTIEELTGKQIIKLKCGFRAPEINFRHIDEIMCFMPYGSNKFKIWFYGELNRTSFSNLLDKIPEIEKEHNIIKNKFIEGTISPEQRRALIQELKDCMIAKLNKERMENLEMISHVLFGKTFSESSDNFVFFPFYSHKRALFNRTWIETLENVICLFPEVDTIEKKKINEEMLKVKSMINESKPIEHYYIQTLDPKELAPEGSVHCLIKQRFEKP